MFNYIRDFQSLFEFVGLSETLADKNFVRIREKIQLLNNIILFQVKEEIEATIWKLTTKEDRELFIRKLSRDLLRVSKGIDKHHPLLNKYYSGEIDLDQMTIFENYIVLCVQLRYQFQEHLNLICADLNLPFPFKVSPENLLYFGHNHLFQSKSYNGVEIFKLKDYENNQEAPDGNKATEFSKIEASLKEYGFFDLEKVKKVENKDALIDFLFKSDTPYQIAMLDHLDFIKTVGNKYAEGNLIKNRNKIIADILQAKVENVKNNINALVNKSPRYTSWQHNIAVINDYNSLR